MIRFARSLFVGLGGLTICCSGYANKLTTTVLLDATYSNNSNFHIAPHQGVDDLWLSPGIAIDYLFDYPNLAATLNYRVTRTHYRKHTFPDRTDFLGLGTIKWTLAEQRLYWNFSDDRRRATIDSTATPTPNNEATRDVISTGPTLQFNVGATHHISMSANYVQSKFNKGGLFASRQGQYALRYFQSVGGSGTNVGLLASYSRSSSDALSLRYRSERYGLTANNTELPFQYDLTLGWNAIHRNNQRATSGIYVSLSASLSGQSSTWSVSANRELTDSAIGLSLSFNLPSSVLEGNPAPGTLPVDTNSNLGFSDTVDISNVHTSYEYQAGRTFIIAGLFYGRQNFQTLIRKEQRKGGSLTLGFKFTPRTSVSYEFFGFVQDVTSGTAITQRYRLNEKSNRLELKYTPNTWSSATVWVAYRTGRYHLGNLNYIATEGGFTIRYNL